MADRGPSAYSITVSVIRDYDPRLDRPPKNSIWLFNQLVWSEQGCTGALCAAAQKLFKLYPRDAMLLPVGSRGQIIVAPNQISRLLKYLEPHAPDDDGNYHLKSIDARLDLEKMKALSGDFPKKLTPEGESDYTRKMQLTFEEPYRKPPETLVPMHSPLRREVVR